MMKEKMFGRRKIKRSVLVSLIFLSSVLLAGCKTTIYAIDGSDIYHNDKGDVCMSEFYLDNVLKAKIRKRSD